MIYTADVTAKSDVRRLPASVSHDGISLYYQNAGGLRSKLPEFYLSVCESDFDVLAISESWLVPSVLDAEVVPTSYNIFRCDRVADPHGGVFLASKKSLDASLISSWNPFNYECVYV